jgi:hypothetical protein
MSEHQGYIGRREWSKSGFAAHKENCSGTTDFANPEILATVQGKSKQQVKPVAFANMCERQIRLGLFKQ